jgi:hypothetical protein
MSIKLSDTQLVLLCAAAQPKHLYLVAPPTLKGATAQKVASKLPAAADLLEGMGTHFAKPDSYPTDGRGVGYSMGYSAPSIWARASSI